MKKLTDEQRKIIEYDGKDLIVSASAGSGKTFVMIERVVRLILEGKAKVSEILAVTFTEKAAADMKEKLSRALIDEIVAGKTALAGQLNAVKTADISTIHSFCLKLLKTYFFEAGLPADFSIIDELDADYFKNRAINSVFDRLYEERDERLFKLLKVFSKKRKDAALKEKVLELFNFFSSKADFEAAVLAVRDNFSEEKFKAFLKEFVNYHKENLRAFIYESEKLANDSAVIGFAPYVEYFGKTVPDILSKIIDEEDVYTGIYLMTLPSRPRAKSSSEEMDALKKEADGLVKRIKEKCFDIVKSELHNYEEDYAAFKSSEELTTYLSELVLIFNEEYGKIKLEEGKVDFNDLERFTYKLFQNKEILNEIKSRYKYVFVDEYQDVNDVQEYIIKSITNGNLFVVGDVKQSIYGFRGCNPNLFKEKFDDFDKKNQAAKLNVNFRCAEKVVDFVNRVMDYAMTESVGGIDYKNKARLVFGGTYDKGEGRAEYHVVEKAEDNKKALKPRIYSVKTATEEAEKDNETSAQCNVICDVIESELNKTYCDTEEKDEDKKYKRINYGDIAVLLRDNKGFAKLLTAEFARRGIPYDADAKLSVTTFPEIKFLIDVLNLLDFFEQDAPLISVLKSNICRLSDEDLIDIRKFYSEKVKGNSEFYKAVKYYADNMDDEISKKLKKFYEYFKGLRLLSEYVGAGAILEKIIDDNNLDAYFMLKPAGKQKGERIRRFLDEAYKENYTVREFLDRINAEEDKMALSVSAGENTVKIMTMHASKGLEFPVTIVANVNSKFKEMDLKKEVIIEKNIGFALKNYYKDEKYSDSLLTLIAKIRKRRAALEEELRLLYVALTRAKYSLHVVQSEKNACGDVLFANSLADFMPPDLAFTYHELNNGENTIEIKASTESKNLVLSGSKNEELKEIIKENLTFEYPFKEATTLPLKTTVTATLKNSDEAVYRLFTEKDEIDEGIKTGKERGTLMHRFLENLDFTKKDDVEGELSRMLRLSVFSEEEAKLLDLKALKKALANNIFDELSGFNLYREQGFIVSAPASLLYEGKGEDEVLLQGVIDLLAIKDNIGYIIDYKYSLKSNEGLKQTYRKQLDLYRYAAEKSLGVKVVKVALLSLLKGEIIEID